MSRTSRLIVGALATLAAAAVAAITVPSGQTEASTGPGVIRISSVETFRRGGSGIGAHLIIRQRLYNTSYPNPLGHAYTVCTTVAPHVRQCFMTYILPRGKLVVSGLETRALAYTLAIIGGTGVYNNARGSLTARTVRLSPRRQSLVFLLVG